MNCFKVLHIQIRSEGGKEENKFIQSEILFLTTKQFNNETNKSTAI